MASLANKIKKIRDKVGDLTYDDRLHVLSILKQHTPLPKIIEHADGCRVNMDTLPADLIDKIYYMVESKLNISEKDMI